MKFFGFTQIIFSLCLVITLVITSCSDSNVYSKSELWEMATAEDPNVEIIMPKDINAGVKCINYGAGCLGGMTVKVRKVHMIVVEFESEESAKIAAIKVDQYYSRNYLFDDVTGEPVLEDFVKKVFAAKKK